MTPIKVETKIKGRWVEHSVVEVSSTEIRDLVERLQGEGFEVKLSHATGYYKGKRLMYSYTLGGVIPFNRNPEFK